MFQRRLRVVGVGFVASRCGGRGASPALALAVVVAGVSTTIAGVTLSMLSLDERLVDSSVDVLAFAANGASAARAHNAFETRATPSFFCKAQQT